jgi:hypothetical protein
MQRRTGVRAHNAGGYFGEHWIYWLPLTKNEDLSGK